ncbi:dTMP kinase [Actinoplanes sp. NPDC051513]|uniref:dTMP kinase n=1 Tax=Actinoplanes sp. NPDC051513 TaxID=3363908 RepID=UPI0037882B85
MTLKPRTIALVGIDGSGKTTQAHRLADDLAAEGLKAAYRRNAGGRRWFGRLAARLGRGDDAEDLLGRRGMLFVESVLRWLAILRTLLRRALTGEITVMDRYAVCQYASLRARAAGPRAERRARWAYRLFPKPGVTFLLVVDPQIAHDRIEARGYDHESTEYLAGAAAAYRSLPEYDSFVVIDANGTPGQVAAAIRARLPLPAPVTPAGSRARAMILAGAPLLAGATALGYQLVEAL